MQVVAVLIARRRTIRDTLARIASYYYSVRIVMNVRRTLLFIALRVVTHVTCIRPDSPV